MSSSTNIHGVRSVTIEEHCTELRSNTFITSLQIETDDGGSVEFTLFGSTRESVTLKQLGLTAPSQQPPKET